MAAPLPTRDERLAPTPDGPGMSLRDWFAGEVMAVMRGENPHASSAQVAEGAYEDADAMMAARRRGEAPDKGEESDGR